MDEKPTYDQLRKRVQDLEERLARETVRSTPFDVEGKYRYLFEVLNEGIWVIDKDARTSHVNSPMARMLDREVAEMLGKPISLFVPSDQKEGIERLLARRAGSMGEKHEFRFLKKDGSLIHAIVGTAPILNEDGNYAGAIAGVMDITALLRAREGEQRLRRDAEYRLKQSIQADRLVALGEVVAGVAHEINNPNSFITYNVPMLKEIWEMLEPVVMDHAKEHPIFKGKRIQPDEMIQDMNDVIESIRIGSERITKVVVNLKDFARLDEGPEFKPIHINEVIEKTLTIVGSQLRRSADKVITRLDEDLPEILGHFGRIEQVLANLFTNASHALPQKRGSVISVSTRYLERLRCVIVTVEDNGSGMKADTLYRIFEPFYTTRRSTGGTGLGLSISHGIVKDHGGILGVYSKPDLGTCFTLFLPEDQDVKLELEPTILCVDDEKSFAQIIKAYFAKAKPAPAEVITDPEKVLAYLEEYPEIDVVVSDIRMPHLNGWELLERIKARFPLINVILYSGHPDELENEAGYAAKPDGLLRKPFKLKYLEEQIQKMGRCLL